ncbi:hypothetical protein PybrP1_005213 [[Pythium] brassicae (nom. inval.)]|nr:hypothetical protein PybrP1_005213 [[Pythium] brassicae (nom. inval.)]
MLFPAATAADENVVSYELFFATDAAATPPDEDSDSAAVALAREQTLAFAAEFTRGFVWQCQRFHLSPPARFSASDADGNIDHTAPATPSNKKRLRRSVLRGETRVGDEIRDEWVVVALLMELSRAFPDALVRVHDGDGEFLLIECADALPEWAHPENCGGRVLLRDGALHLVPPRVVPEPSDGSSAAQHQQRRRRRRRQQPKQRDDSVESETALRCLHAVLEQPALTRANDALQRALASKLREVPRFMRENRHRVRCLLPVSAAQVLARHPAVLGAAVEAFYYREPTQAASICARMPTFSPRAGLPTERMVAFSRCMYAQLKQQQFFAPKPFQSASGYREYARATPLGGAERGDADLVGAEPSDPTALAAEIGMKLACGLELLYAQDGENQFGQPWRRVIDEALALSTVSPSDAVDVLLGENDDDAWLYMHPDSLEEQLRQVEASMGARAGGNDAEGGAEELESIATMFNNFLGGISGIDGVEGNEPIQFDMSAFMDVLGADSGGPQRTPRFSDGGEYVNDDDDDDGFGDEDSSDDDDDDSDDEIDARMEAAMAEMDAELSTTHLAKSFARVDSSEATGTTNAHADDELDDEIAADKPLDLDFNLLSNLLESFASQDGHAGPVSNILGELGFPRAL